MSSDRDFVMSKEEREYREALGKAILATPRSEDRPDLAMQAACEKPVIEIPDDAESRLEALREREGQGMFDALFANTEWDGTL